MSNTVGVMFGGRSVEHEVSVITAQQAMAALSGAGFAVTPVYIAKDGGWYTGDALRELGRFADVARLLTACTRVSMRPDPASGGALFEVAAHRSLRPQEPRPVARFDVAMPLVHGSHGEDGTLPALFELSEVAYTGCGVAAAAVSMDKPLAKAVMRAAGLVVIDHLDVERSAWAGDREAVARTVESRFAYPMFVKPRSLGSSIGVSRVESRSELEASLELALVYDSRALVEPAMEGIIEINCAVLGNATAARASVCEQPLAGGVLSYADKYLTKGAGKNAGMKGSQRIIPAQLPDTLTARIQQVAVDAFHAIDAEGVARVDFLVRPERDELVVNEINTVPGSLSFYLWERSGVPFAELVTELVDLAQRRHAAKRATTYSIDSWLLSGVPPA